MIVRRNSRRAGAALVEMAVASLPLTMVLFGLFEYCRYEMHRHQMTSAAREAARLAVVGKRSVSTDEVRARAAKMLGNQGKKPAQVDIYRATAAGQPLGPWDDAAPGEFIAVRVTSRYSPLFPSLGFLPKEFPVQVTQSMRNETN